MIAVYNVFTIQSHGYLETIPDTALGRHWFVSLGMTQRPPDWLRAFCLLLSWFLLSSPLSWDPHACRPSPGCLLQGSMLWREASFTIVTIFTAVMTMAGMYGVHEPGTVKNDE